MPIDLFGEEKKRLDLFADDKKANVSGEVKPGSGWESISNNMMAEERAEKERNQQTALKASQNFIPSIVDLGRNIYQAVRHPIDTATGIKHVVQGFAEKIYPKKAPGEHEKYADAFMDMFKERYKDDEAIRKTIEEDPAGFLADVSTFFSGSGAVVRGGAAIAKSSEAAKIGITLGKIGATLDPVSMTIQFPATLAGKSIPKTGRFSPESAYESAIKPSMDLSMEERLLISTTALQENIMPTRNGLIKTKEMIQDIEDTVTEVVNAGAHRGDRITISNATQGLNDLRTKLSETIEPEKYLKKINRVENNLLQGYGHDIPVDLAHRIKKNTYWELKNLYGEMQKDAAVEAKKVIARGMKEEIYNLYPELRALGKKEGALIELESSLERAVNRISNRDLAGIGVPVKGTMGGVVAGPVGATIGLIVGILDTPNIKARLARALYKARDGIGALPYSKTRMSAFQSERMEKITEQEED